MHCKLFAINVNPFAKLYFVKNVYRIYKVLIIVSIIVSEKRIVIIVSEKRNDGFSSRDLLGPSL